MTEYVSFDGRIAQSVSIIFTTPGELKKDELPPWFKILPVKYQTNHSGDATYHRLYFREIPELKERFESLGMKLIKVTCREKVGVRGVTTQTNFTFGTSNPSIIPEESKDEAMLVFHFLLKRKRGSFAALSQEEHSPFFVILFG